MYVPYTYDVLQFEDSYPQQNWFSKISRLEVSQISLDTNIPDQLGHIHTTVNPKWGSYYIGEGKLLDLYSNGNLGRQYCNSIPIGVLALGVSYLFALYLHHIATHDWSAFTWWVPIGQNVSWVVKNVVPNGILDIFCSKAKTDFLLHWWEETYRCLHFFPLQSNGNLYRQPCNLILIWY